MTSRTWQSAEEEFKSWWQGKQCYCFQFHDTRAAMGASGSKRVFTTQHPSDFIVTDNGVTFFAEVKQSASEVSFPFSNIKTNQWSAARQTVAAKGKYYFFLFSTSKKSWYRIEGSFLVDLMLAGKKSVRWSELSEHLWTPPVHSIL